MNIDLLKAENGFVVRVNAFHSPPLRFVAKDDFDVHDIMDELLRKVEDEL